MARIPVRLTPRAGRDAIDGWVENRLCARVAAPAVDGRANDAFVQLLARSLAISPARILIVAGHRSRMKQVVIEGIDAEELRQRLG